MKRLFERSALGGTLFLFLALIGGVVLFPFIFHFIPPGYSGVRWMRFFGGTELINSASEGTVLTFPWDKINLYDVRVQIRKISIDVLMQDGLPLNVDLSVRFHPNNTKLGVLQRVVGPDYFERQIEPHTAAEARNVLALYAADNVYSANRKNLQNTVQQEVISSIHRDFVHAGIDDKDSEEVIVIDEVLFMSIKLPDLIAEAIERKNTERQRVERLEFAIQAEDQERKRKIIEANGVRSFQEIIKSGLTEQFLKWKGIEATTQLAQSPNAKIVIFGNGPSGLPLILGGFDAPPPVSVPVPHDAVPVSNGGSK